MCEELYFEPRSTVTDEKKNHMNERASERAREKERERMNTRAKRGNSMERMFIHNTNYKYNATRALYRD